MDLIERLVNQPKLFLLEILLVGCAIQTDQVLQMLKVWITSIKLDNVLLNIKSFGNQNICDLIHRLHQAGAARAGALRTIFQILSTRLSLESLDVFNRSDKDLADWLCWNLRMQGKTLQNRATSLVLLSNISLIRFSDWRIGRLAGCNCAPLRVLYAHTDCQPLHWNHLSQSAPCCDRAISASNNAHHCCFHPSLVLNCHHSNLN